MNCAGSTGVPPVTRMVRTLAINALFVALLMPVMGFTAVEWAAYQASLERKSRFPIINTTAWLPDDGPGFNPENMYWVVEYDCRETDVAIQGIVPPAKYWSMVPYDRYTMPLGSYLCDQTIQKESTGQYTAFLTVRPRGRTNEIDVSASPRGLLLIRILLPENPAEVARQAPVVRPVPRD
jgi:hypothetical protein